MSNPIWQRLDALAGAAVDSVWAEPVQLNPRTEPSPYVAAMPDRTRPVRTVRGIYSEETKAENLRGQRLSGEGRGTTEFVNSFSAVQIIAAQAALLEAMPRKGDLLVLLARQPCPLRFSINLVDQLDSGDLVLYLSPEAAT